MGREIHKLLDRNVRVWTKNPPTNDKGNPVFVHGDGGGLWLSVTPPRGASWIFRYAAPLPFIGKDGKSKPAGRMREMGLGPYPDVSLAAARDAAGGLRRLRTDGKDPIAERDARRAAERLEAAKAMTFKDAAAAYIEDNRDGWKNAKHAAQWTATLSTYAFPIFGGLPIAAVDVGLVTKALRPIWATKTETAARLRGRIENVLDWAKAHGYREGENPARWHGHLENILPKRSDVQKVEHHAAMPYSEIGAFMVKLREHGGKSADALEFLILTAGRTGEIIGARWDEIDFDAKLWVIPAARMKAARDHRVPLPGPAIDILHRMERTRLAESEYVFAKNRIFADGRVENRPLSNMALLMLLRRMGHGALTAHGFRSTFRDWVAEKTNFPAEVAEMALAHAVGDKVEAAYRRGELLQKRFALANAWAAFCSSVPRANVVPISAVAASR